MKQFKIEEDHKLSGENIQGVEIATLLQDSEAFENLFFPTDPLDYNPNEYIDFNELHELLNEGNINGEGVNGGGHGGNMVPFQMNSDVVAAEAKHKDEGHAQNHVKKMRYKKGSAEAIRRMELKTIRNRESARRAFEEKKAYPEQLEVSVKEFRMKNARLKKLLELGMRNLSSGQAQKRLKRTASGPL